MPSTTAVDTDDSVDEPTGADFLTTLHARLPWLIPLAIWVLAFTARFTPLMRGAGLRSAGVYDDGVYYTASAAMVGGRVPYRDFLLLHPPGIMLIAAPFTTIARFTSDPAGMALARLAVMAVSAFTAVLIYYVAKRLGLLAGLVAGLFYAFWMPSVWDGFSLLLEPFVDLGLVTALLLLGNTSVQTRRRMIWAGVAMGAACSVKVWAIIPVVIIVVWIWTHGGLRRVGYFLGGAAAAAVVICGPFFVLAPRAMARMVIADQLARDTNSTNFFGRLGSIAGLRLTADRPTTLFAAVALLTVVAALAVAAFVAWKVSEARLWVILFVAQAATIMFVGVYFNHYADFPAVPLSLVVGTAAWFAATSARHVSFSRERVVTIGAIVLVALMSIAPFTRPGGTRLPIATLQRNTKHAHCVTTDNPITLVEANVLTRNLRRGCRVVVDPTGLSYDIKGSPLQSGSTVVARAADAAWQKQFMTYALSGDAFVLNRSKTVGLSPASFATLSRYPLLVNRPNLKIYDTGATPSPAPTP